jgi:hypothetical protein
MSFMKNIFFIYGRGKLLLEQRVEERFKIQDFINKAQAQCATGLLFFLALANKDSSHNDSTKSATKQ